VFFNRLFLIMIFFFFNSTFSFPRMFEAVYKSRFQIMLNLFLFLKYIVFPFHDLDKGSASQKSGLLFLDLFRAGD